MNPENRKDPALKKAKTRLLIAAATIAVISVFSATAVLAVMNSGGTELPSTPAEFIISSGESAYGVGARLAQHGYIRSELFFKLIAKIRKAPIQKGCYEVVDGDSALRIYSRFANGRQKMVQFTVPEGRTLNQTAQIIEDQGICDRVDFLAAAETHFDSGLISNHAASVEGFLFPDTYTVPAHSDAELVVEAMVNRSREVIDSFPLSGRLSRSQLYERIVLASIVEKEYRALHEAPLIASVFLNRLRTGMKLQSCATVVYVITEIQEKPHPSRLFYKDLDINNPYNSYRFRGLPPGPICSPGETALNAVFNPAESDYLYFVVKDLETGEHFFSSDLAQHEKGRLDYVNRYHD